MLEKNDLIWDIVEPKYQEVMRLEKEILEKRQLLDSRNKLYIKELTKKIFREQKINKDNIYKILNGIDFDISFYIEWENFASYLFNRIKEQNLLKE